jgi:hypothetical protein
VIGVADPVVHLDHSDTVAEYWATPTPAVGGWSPALVVLAGVVGVLMWGGLLWAVLAIGQATSGVVHDVGSVAVVML